MSAAKELGGAGLRGQSAGSTALCTVGKTGTGLTYRGYDITDLAHHAQFEEVAHLLLVGYLPTQAELDQYKTRLIGLRGLPEKLKQALELIPAEAHPMDVMRTAAPFLATLSLNIPSLSNKRRPSVCWRCFLRLFVTGIASVMKGCGLIPPIKVKIRLAAISSKCSLAKRRASCSKK